MILAAGRGQRMMPLTASCPKPLLAVNDKPLIVYHIENLVAAGFNQIVINHAYLGQQIVDAIGDGGRFGAQIDYSAETHGGLETAGGIIQALPKLSSNGEAFVVVNGDIWTDYDLTQLNHCCLGNDLAHLVLVDNPPHNPCGDFGLDSQGRVIAEVNLSELSYTFSGIGLYSPQLFAGVAAGKVPLAPILRKMMATQQVSGEYYQGLWTDVGTPERLEQLDNYIRG